MLLLKIVSRERVMLKQNIYYQGSIFFSERGLSTWWVIVVLTLSLPGISHFVIKTVVQSQMSICYVSNSLKSIIPHIPSHHLQYHLQDLNLLISQL